MFGVVLGGFAGLVIMDRTVIHMMMTGAFQVYRLVGKVECFSQRRPPSLHGKAMQGQ